MNGIWKRIMVCIALFIAMQVHAADLEIDKQPQKPAEEEVQEESFFANFRFISELEQHVEALKESRPVAEGLRQYSFVTRVGGIAFDSIAVPSAADLGNVKLVYTPSKPDGTRFSVHVNGSDYTLPGADWKLVPILNYVASPYFACFTLFGTSGNADKDRELKELHGLRYLCSYHPAFKNTLMGLRLMQMDSFLTDLASFDKLPTNNKGQDIQGSDERPRNASGSTLSQKRKLIELIERNERFQAYVITDSRNPVSFSLSKDNYVDLKGNLFVYFWRTAENAQEIQERIYAEAARAHNVTLGTNNSVSAFSQASLDSFKKEVQERADKELLVYCKALSEDMEQSMDVVRSINPVVYDAVRDVMRFGAFFRYCRISDPESFEKALKLAAEVKVYPLVQTPNCVTR